MGLIEQIERIDAQLLTPNRGIWTRDELLEERLRLTTQLTAKTKKLLDELNEIYMNSEHHETVMKIILAIKEFHEGRE